MLYDIDGTHLRYVSWEYIYNHIFHSGILMGSTQLELPKH